MQHYYYLDITVYSESGNVIVTDEKNKENLLDKAKNLWQSAKDKVNEINIARQEKKEAKLEERKRKEEGALLWPFNKKSPPVSMSSGLSTS